MSENYRGNQEMLYGSAVRDLGCSIEEFKKHLEKQFANHIVLKAVVDETIMGSVRANEQDRTCCIGKLMVHPKHQNQGIGRKLMNSIEGLFPKLRYELFTGNKSEKNISLYEKLGYKIFRERLITSDFSLVYLEKKVLELY